MKDLLQEELQLNYYPELERIYYIKNDRKTQSKRGTFRKKYTVKIPV